MLLVSSDENQGQAIEVKPLLSPSGVPLSFNRGINTSIPTFDVQLYPKERKNNSPALRQSAQIGGDLAYRLLWDEEALKNEKGEFAPYQATSNFILEPVPANVHGRSADLLFALAVVTAALPLNGGATTHILLPRVNWMNLLAKCFQLKAFPQNYAPPSML
jgi:hypothetical protein